MQKSGVYTFKTTDSDSKPYPHKITSLDVLHGEVVSEFVITYEDTKQQKSIVKVKVRPMP